MQHELCSFDPEFAATIVSWVPTETNLLWLAPRTPPPLTVQKVFGWNAERTTPYLLFADGGQTPSGYAELNRMKTDPTNLWLGHVVIDPKRRRRGLGSHLVLMLLDEAFDSGGAAKVSLVVFPANSGAMRCYLRCGFVLSREEYHRFQPRGPKHRMLRMDFPRARWLKRRRPNDRQPLRSEAPILPTSPEIP